MPQGTLEVLLVGAKGLEGSDFLSKLSFPSKFWVGNSLGRVFFNVITSNGLLVDL